MMPSDTNTTYPDPNKLKEKYSPTKKIPPLREFDIIRDNLVPGSAQRNLARTGRSRSPVGNRLSVLERSKVSNLNPNLIDSKLTPVLTGRLSPVRRSGSPERRSHISEIEHSGNRKRQSDEETDLYKRSKNVAFKECVKVNDISDASIIKDSNTLVDSHEEDVMQKFNNFMDTINKRLDRIESVQYQILKDLNERKNLQNNENEGYDN